ncbi:MULTISPECIES: hypothetical protein [unclassified Pseudoclavibacter]|uniref:hypothetical protein n=1 Tax=unclassified Pseudoclavibacter TaxID=2615177 RepID=UPI0012EFC192|nr:MULTISPECIES: hypothetical protein [unclassified Pseudoclavibacter]MBF4460370.1 hypothetical protein [Pseudoclavibacter sp. VKM Ac-2867]VXB83266.1 conserved hypothetical protein [Pseudoclavibacter sp. 8L]
MSPVLRISDLHAARDLESFLGRAGRIEDGAVRIVQAGTVAAFWVPVLRPQGLLDTSPLVLGVRALRAELQGAADDDVHAGAFDATVPLRGLLDRLARLRSAGGDAPSGEADAAAGFDLAVPPERLRESWAGIAAPTGGWTLAGAMSAATLIAAADQGIAEVADAVPGNLGTALVERVRTEVWTRVIDEQSGLTSGAAFAALSLGFLRSGEETRILTAGAWLRLETTQGNVLLRSSSAR